MNISDHINNATLNSTDTNNLFGCSNETSANYLSQAENVIRKGVTPVLLLFGIIGNLLTIVVIIRQRKTASFTSVTLLVVALADLLSLVSYYMPDWLEAISGYDLISSSQISCQISSYISYSSFIISPWGLVAITTERLVNIMKPSKAKSLFTARSSVYTLSFVSAIAMLVSGYVFANDVSDTLDVYRFSCSIFRIDYDIGFSYIWFIIYTSLCCYVPVFVLCVGNSVIVWKMYVRNKQSNSLGSSSTANRQKQTLHLYKLVTLLNSVFVLSQIPLSVFPVFSTSHQTSLTSGVCTAHISFGLLFYSGFVVAQLNPSLNFMLYFVSNRNFRAEIKAFFRGANSGVKHIFGESR